MARPLDPPGLAVTLPHVLTRKRPSWKDMTQVCEQTKERDRGVTPEDSGGKWEVRRVMPFCIPGSSPAVRHLCPVAAKGKKRGALSRKGSPKNQFSRLDGKVTCMCPQHRRPCKGRREVTTHRVLRLSFAQRFQCCSNRTPVATDFSRMSPPVSKTAWPSSKLAQ